MFHTLNPGMPFNTNFEVCVSIQVIPYSTKELATLYGVTEKTFLKWLSPFQEDIGCKIGKYYTVLQVEGIFCRLGVPYLIRERS